MLFRGGDIIVAPSCWQWANPNEYIYEKLQDGIHTLILASSILYDTSAKETFEDNICKIKKNKIRKSLFALKNALKNNQINGFVSCNKL